MLLTSSRGIIFLIIDPLSELPFFGLLSSIVRAPYILLKRTSSGSSCGSSRGIDEDSVAICIACKRRGL